MRKLLLFLATYLPIVAIHAAPPSLTSKYIKIDQFGYLPASKKVAVIVDPQVGYNEAESFNPATGVNQYQVRKWADDAVVFSGTLVAWKNGATHVQSGDRGWYFDFSVVTTPGSYYIFDVANNVGSYGFEISNVVYNNVLKQAARMFFYQRINFAKQPPYTDPKWADAAAFGGPNQDFAARSGLDKNNATTAKDLHGGWMDAGDYNKYTSFTYNPLCYLLETYRSHPVYFTDDYNIPESGNGVADILDEVKWELDWLTRMQDGTGTNGLFLKLGADNYSSASPPSTDNNPRYYVPECTSATLTGAAVFSLGSIVYKSLPNAAMVSYGDNLLTRAINAWNRAKFTTNNFNSFETTCDSLYIVAGDADKNADVQIEMIVTAAAYLYEATGNAEYKNCFDTLYVKTSPISFFWWGPYATPVEQAMLRYTSLPGATASVANSIKTSKAVQNSASVLGIDAYTDTIDLYRSYMPDAQFHWNSNEVKSTAGLNNYDFVSFNINTAQSDLYKETAEGYLHWFHGINPMGKVMLSNMYGFGGDDCVNEFYHTWFGDGTIWDNVFTSANGPAPGYLVGGVNKNFNVQPPLVISPPMNQPVQKSYKEWNTGWNSTYNTNENSWEITEAGIYTQAAYISLLVRTIANSPAVALPLHVINISANRQNKAVLIKWQVTSNTDSKEFELQRSTDGVNFNTVATITALNNKENYETLDNDITAQQPLLYYRIMERDKMGRVFYSAIAGIKDAGKKDWVVYPNPVTDKLVINGNTDNPETILLTIYTADGKPVITKKWAQAAGSFSTTVSVNDLSKGTYWLQLSSEKRVKKIKFVKQ
jgi:endoglucanase